MKVISPFEFVGHEEKGSVWVANIPLPDDGTPDSKQSLRIEISTNDSDTFEIRLERFVRGETQPIAETTSRAHNTIANVLYGVARSRTIKILEPIR